MQKFTTASLTKFCLTLLSLTLLGQTAFGYENKVSYLDSVSSQMIYGSSDARYLLDMNSIDARSLETTLRLDATQTITDSNAVVNLSLRDSDLRQVLRMLADKAKLNIVFDKSVDGKITLDLTNIKVNDAFMVIFKSSQLTYTMDGNTITVMTIENAKKVAYTRQSMTSIPIKYVNAESVAEFLNENLFKSNIFGLSNKPVVTANRRTNQIIVFGTNADVLAIKRLLPILDTKPMVNTFVVNHVTPKEMADLICNSLFYDEDEKEGEDDDSSSDSSDDSDDEIILGAGKVACRDISSSSSSGSSSSDSGEGLKPFKTTPLTITYFTDSGKITALGGSVEQVEVIKEFIKEHDKKQMMAYVELSVISLNETGSKQFQNAWNLWTPFVSLGFSKDTGFYVGEESDKFFLWKDRFEGGSSTNNKALVYQLKYIIDQSNGRMLNNPKVVVTNGKKSVIDMTSDYLKSITTQMLQSTASGEGALGTSQTTYEIGSDEGLLIEIVPFISPDGYVSMNITPEFATIKQSTNAYTLLERRDLELKNVRIKDGETLVLAGLIKENESKTTSKMPILSDLPFIGAFFRSNDTKLTRDELVILITPHILKDNEGASSEKIYDL